MKITVNTTYRSLSAEDITDFELPDFTVITGPNGSGKSHLLNGISSNHILLFEDGSQTPIRGLRLFALGELIVTAEVPQNDREIVEPWKQSFNTIQDARRNYAHMSTPQLEEMMRRQLVDQQKLVTDQGWSKLASTGKPVTELSAVEFERLHPLAAGTQDIFSTSLSSLFVTYSKAKFRNDVLAFSDDAEALSKEQFIQHSGPPPWQLLDETLQIIGLPYKFVPPAAGLEGVTFSVTLTGPSGITITLDQLSSGERVLLALATAMYTGSNLSNAVQVPNVLLLDEADASLHPTMVRSLLTVIQDLFIKQYGVRVLLTTHSPTTVALAPEESLYTMSKSRPRIQKTSADEAIKSLTAGISTLSVRTDNRRQVFVESEYDQKYLQSLFTHTKELIGSEISLEFIAVGRKDKGGGCDAVLRMVNDLRSAGSETVFGLIDRDKRTSIPDGVHCVADRHSIENLILDPLLLGTFLLREGMFEPQQLDLAAGIRHYELTPSHAQAVIAAISSRMKFSGRPEKEVSYAGEFSATAPLEWFETQGHHLQSLILDEIPSLKKFKEKLLSEIVGRAVKDKPDFVPRALIEVFRAIA